MTKIIKLDKSNNFLVDAFNKKLEIQRIPDKDENVD